jgi:hypothetical protein
MLPLERFENVPSKMQAKVCILCLQDFFLLWRNKLPQEEKPIGPPSVCTKLYATKLYYKVHGLEIYVVI